VGPCECMKRGSSRRMRSSSRRIVVVVVVVVVGVVVVVVVVVVAVVAGRYMHKCRNVLGLVGWLVGLVVVWTKYI
jgi:ABC-type lipoprotein release transport system permease subunit